MPYKMNTPVYVGGFATMAAGAGVGYSGLTKLGGGNERQSAASNELVAVRATADDARTRMTHSPPALFGPDSPTELKATLEAAEARIATLESAVAAGARSAATGVKLLGAATVVLLAGMTLGLSGTEFVSDPSKQ